MFKHRTLLLTQEGILLIPGKLSMAFQDVVKIYQELATPVFLIYNLRPAPHNH